MSIDRTEAIILRKRDFRETSLIVDFYTRTFGKVSGILKGIRVDSSKFASDMEIFSLNEIIFYRKRNSALHLVSQADKIENFTAIRQNMQKINFATMMMELLLALMPQEDPNEDVFNLSLSCLSEIQNSSNPEKIATIFKIKMLSLSGFKPHFDSCVSCGSKILGESKFSLSLGGLLCERCFKKDLSSRSVFRGTVASILHIERNDLRANLNLGMNPQIKKELDLMLNAFLQFHLEKELKSQRVINKIDNYVTV